MGRSVGEIITTIDTLFKEGVMFEAIKEGISLNGKHDLFGLFAKIERELISVRTKEGLAAARASGKVLGRPKGSLGVSKLNGREDEIRRLLSMKVSKASIAKITGVGESTLYHFLSTREVMRVS
jgi:DNA invertase Pin-like site-specific DNA recombinase